MINVSANYVSFTDGIVKSLSKSLGVKYANGLLDKKQLFKIDNGPNHKPLHRAGLEINERWMKSNSLEPSETPGLCSNIDLVAGKYEGGFKVWECCRDLVKMLLDDDDKCIEAVLRAHSEVRVLELGAGSCLPSIALMLKFESFRAVKLNLHLHDYNWQVLATLGLINFYLNSADDCLQTMLDEQRLRFFHGHWKDFASLRNHKYHLILMSEVLYNCDNYEALHEILIHQLDADGLVFIATKETYFGLSGDMTSWLEFVESKGKLKLLSCKQTSADNIPRSILTFKHI